MNATQYADAYYQVAAKLMFSRQEFFGRSRRQPLALSRQIGMYLCRKNTDSTLADTGAAFGRRGYDTVIYAKKVIAEKMSISREMRVYVSKIESSINII